MRVLILSIAVGIICATIAANRTFPCFPQYFLHTLALQVFCSILGFFFGVHNVLSLFWLFSKNERHFSPLLVSAGVLVGALAGLLIFYLLLAAGSFFFLHRLLFMSSWVSFLILNLSRLGIIGGCAFYGGSRALRHRKPLPKSFSHRVRRAIGSLLVFLLPLIFLWVAC